MRDYQGMNAEGKQTTTTKKNRTKASNNVEIQSYGIYFIDSWISLRASESAQTRSLVIRSEKSKSQRNICVLPLVSCNNNKKRTQHTTRMFTFVVFCVCRCVTTDFRHDDATKFIKNSDKHQRNTVWSVCSWASGYTGLGFYRKRFIWSTDILCGHRMNLICCAVANK